MSKSVLMNQFHLLLSRFEKCTNERDALLLSIEIDDLRFEIEKRFNIDLSCFFS